jgi:ATP-dependent helicase/nuclease subunit A
VHRGGILQGGHAMRRPELNAQQESVVSAHQGELFVSAGAGSGKTRVLAERFAEMVLAGEESKRAAVLDRILLITYTEKAAAELTQRVRRAFLEKDRPDLARRVDEAWISTIHGFCARIVRRHALDLGIDPAFSVLADPDVGVVRAAAFDIAARQAIRSEDVARMVAAYSLDEVRTSVMQTYDQVRAMGRDVAELRLPPEPDLAAAGMTFLAGTGPLADDLRALKPTATVVRNLAELEALALAVGDLLADRQLGRQDLAAAVYEAASEASFGKQGSPEAKTLAEAASALVSALTGDAAETLAREHAAALSEVVRDFAETYDTMKSARGVLDFEDLQLLTRRLFTSRPEVGRRYASAFDTVMVDEFQDANELQLEALLPVARDILCTVGDDKQSIYGFRFADVGLFRTRRERLSAGAGRCVALPVNYRSHPDLLETFNAVFGSDAFFGDDWLRLEAGRQTGWRTAWPADRPRTEVLLVERDGWDVPWREAEAATLARRLGALVTDGTAQPGDIVVLLRQMTQAQVYATALRREGLEVLLEAGGGFFESREVNDLRALVRTLANPADDGAVLGLLAGGFAGVSDDALCLLARVSGRLWGATADPEAAGLTGRDASVVRLIHTTIASLRAEQGRRSLGDILLDACEALDYGRDHERLRERAAAGANVRKFVRLADDFERTSPGDPGAFIEYLKVREMHSKREKQGNVADGPAGAVRIMSVHAAKGLEFPVVAFADLAHKARSRTELAMIMRDSDGPMLAMKLPADEAGKRVATPTFARLAAADDAAGEEEAKRLFYVACTRAEEALIMCGTAVLDKPPVGSTALDRLRRALGDDTRALRLPNTVVTLVRPGGEWDHVGRAAAGDHAEAAAESPVPPARPEAGEPRTPADGLGTAVAPGPHTGPDMTPPPAELSFTTLAQYEACPYRFYAQRILGVGSAVRSVEPGPLDVGNAVHAALRLRAAFGDVSEERLAAICRRHGLKGEAGARVRAAVDAFAATPIARRAGQAGWSRSEAAFAVPIRGRMLVGSLDLVFREGETAVVIDYKTGQGELTEAEAAGRYRRQAECYALAAFATGAREAAVHFVEVERGARTTSFAFATEDAAAIQDGIAAAFARMEAGEFGRRGGFEPHICGDCPVSGSLCPVTPPRRGAASAGRTPRRCPPPARP